jgi:hypothetical protein
VDGARAFGPCLRRLRLWDHGSDGILLQSVLENFVESADVGDLQVAEDFWRKIGHGVGLVVGRQKDVSYAGAFCAKRFLIGRLVSKLMRAVTIAAPADGPSFGTPPEGTWMWMSILRKKSGSMP